MKFININKSKIPYRFELNLKNETFQFEILYNTLGDFFTINLFKNHNLVRYGEKIVYGVPLFNGLEHLEIPKVVINPLDTTERAVEVTFENLNEDVFLYVLDT